MSFPDLTPTPTGVLHGSGTGVPVNGVNEFDAGIDLAKYDKELGVALVNDWLVVRVWALGTSVILATFAGRTGSKIRVNFSQTGVDPCFVETELIHSSIR
jgi:hypothetical protein